MAAPPIAERHLHHFHRRSPIKESVRAATTANITIATALNNGDTLDGVTLATDDRVLVKNQSTGSQNGIYVVGATPVRAYDQSTDDPAFAFLILVREGTTNALTLWKNTNTAAPTIDTTSITFDSVSSGGGGGASSTVINVMDYGAVEDFSTDNATAFANAVAAMVPGCTLLFPSLTGLGYKTSATISIVERGCRITGTGSEYGTRVHITASNTTLFSVIPTALDGSRNQTNVIEHLLITGPGSASSGSGIYASSDCHVNDVAVAGFYNGLLWDSATFYSRIYGSFFTNCVRGIVLNATNNCTIDTCRIIGNFGALYLLGPVTDGIVLATPLNTGLVNRIVNSSIEYFAGDGIRWNGGAGGELLGNYFETQQSSTGHAHLNLGESNATQALLIAGNHFQGDGTAGFLAIKGTVTEKITVMNNRFGINSAIGITANGGSNSDWLMMNNKNDPAGTFLLPSSSYTLDPSSPPSGTVTSVAQTVPAEFSVTGSPVTTSGTLAISKATQTANTVWAGPTTGSAAQPAFRALVAADITGLVSSSGSDHEHVGNIVFSGDGSTTVWELPAAPVAADAISVYVAGSRSIAWVLSGALLTTLTFDSAPASASNNIVIDIEAAVA